MKATTAIVLDKRRKLNNNTFPVKLRVTFNRKFKRYKTDINLDEKGYEKVMSKSPRGIYKDIKLELERIEGYAAGIIAEMEMFSFSGFESKFLRKHVNTLDVFEKYEAKIEELEKEKRFNTLDTYRNSLKSLKEFHVSNKLLINEINVRFLKNFEKWMVSRNRSLTTVSIYLRTLRAIYNLIIEENRITNIKSPFGKKKYQIPAPRNIKKSLNIKEIQLLYQYQPKQGSTEQKYRDLWFFSYLCNGMNMKDICLLQHKNIQGNHIYFYRNKTINSIRDNKPIDVVIIDEIREIIERWGTNTDNPEDYIFPFVTRDMDAKKIMTTVKQVTKMTNKYIRIIASKVGIDKPISTYWARHSFATVLMRSNVGTEFIREQLGHKSLSTTENYLGSFEDDAKREIANKLLEF